MLNIGAILALVASQVKLPVYPNFFAEKDPNARQLVSCASLVVNEITQKARWPHLVRRHFVDRTEKHNEWGNTTYINYLPDDFDGFVTDSVYAPNYSFPLCDITPTRLQYSTVSGISTGYSRWMIGGVEVTLNNGIKPYILVTPSTESTDVLSFCYYSKSAILPPLWTPGQSYNLGDLVYYSPPATLLSAKQEVMNDRIYICDAAGVAQPLENPIDLARGVIAPTGASFKRNVAQHLTLFTHANQFSVFDPILLALGIRSKFLYESGHESQPSQLEFERKLSSELGKVIPPGGATPGSCGLHEPSTTVNVTINEIL